MAMPSRTGYTYDDLQAFPEDNLRREIIGGELIVTASPAFRHQRVSGRLHHALLDYENAHGGFVCAAPFDVYFGESDVVEPDLIFVTAASKDRIESRFVRGAPDIVVEISSPSTRRLELIRKRALYETYGVPEYWYIDLDADRIEIYCLEADAYGTPELLGRGDVLRSNLLPDFSASVDDILGDLEP